MHLGENVGRHTVRDANASLLRIPAVPVDPRVVDWMVAYS